MLALKKNALKKYVGGVMGSGVGGGGGWGRGSGRGKWKRLYLNNNF